MANPEGTPIWYELLTNDADASTAFYEEVIGWKVQPVPPGSPMHYQMLDTGAGGLVGGMMQLTDEMRGHGAKPTWLFYVGVADVDATAKQAVELGGKVLMPAFDIPDIGRIALLADPQGIPFYVMRAKGEGTSTAFDRTGMGKCNWHELATPDLAAGNAFYEKLFGWKYPDKMAIPGGGEYVFVAVGENRFGGTMKQPAGAPAGWQFYFRAPDIDAAAEKVKKAGGKIHAGPMSVPGGDKVLVASDLHGVPFGIAAAAG